MQRGKLFVVATPIGNLQDITLRAVETLRGADFILCEDTRQTKKLLDKFEMHGKQIFSYHQHSKIQKTDLIIKMLEAGRVGALVSDAGTPGISDPGNDLINEILKKLGGEFSIIAIPGPNAAIAALSISGLANKEFVFLGFPPVTKRNKYFDGLKDIKFTKVFYESPYRVLKTLENLEHVFGPDRKAVVCRELTKIYETTYRGTIASVKNSLENEGPRGEFVIIVE